MLVAIDYPDDNPPIVDQPFSRLGHGFGLPFGVWACTHAELKALAEDAFGSLGHRGIVRRALLDALLRECLPEHPGYYGELVWILMMLELWLQKAGVAARLVKP